MLQREGELIKDVRFALRDTWGSLKVKLALLDAALKSAEDHSVKLMDSMDCLRKRKPCAQGIDSKKTLSTPCTHSIHPNHSVNHPSGADRSSLIDIGSVDNTKIEIYYGNSMEIKFNEIRYEIFITKITSPHGAGGYVLRYENFRPNGEGLSEGYFIKNSVISFINKGQYISEEDIRSHRKLGIFELNPLDTSAVLPLKITEFGKRLARLLHEGDFTELKPLATGLYGTVRTGPEFEIKKFPKTVTVNGVVKPIEIDPYWALRAIPEYKGSEPRIPKKELTKIKYLYPELGGLRDELISEAIAEYCWSFNKRYEKTTLSSIREELLIDFIMTLIERTKDRFNKQGGRLMSQSF